MAGDAPKLKEERCVSYGASVLRSELIDGENREVSAARLAEELSTKHGYTLLHPFEEFEEPPHSTLLWAAILTRGRLCGECLSCFRQ